MGRAGRASRRYSHYVRVRAAGGNSLDGERRYRLDTVRVLGVFCFTGIKLLFASLAFGLKRGYFPQYRLRPVELRQIPRALYGQGVCVHYVLCNSVRAVFVLPRRVLGYGREHLVERAVERGCRGRAHDAVAHRVAYRHKPLRKRG